jgi:hypothetical protein
MANCCKHFRRILTERDDIEALPIKGQQATKWLEYLSCLNVLQVGYDLLQPPLLQRWSSPLGFNQLGVVKGATRFFIFIIEFSIKGCLC